MLAERRRADFLNNDGDNKIPDRPFTLPPGEFRPKQSLGQNFLSDQNYVMKIVNELKDNSQGINYIYNYNYYYYYYYYYYY